MKNYENGKIICKIIVNWIVEIKRDRILEHYYLINYHKNQDNHILKWIRNILNLDKKQEQVINFYN